MKAAFTVLLLFILVSPFAQHGNTNWLVKPYSDLGFTENIGRYENVMNEEIQFFAEYGAYKIFISNDAFVIGTQEELTREEIKERHEEEEHGKEVDPIPWNYFKVEFQGTNKDAMIQPEELKGHTRNFQNPNNLNQTIKARAYSLLRFEKLYDGIDMLVELPEEGGLKYSFLVHPEANYEDIKMTYHRVDIRKKETQELELENEHFLFTDANPKSFSGEELVESQFVVSGNEVTFKIEDYDPLKELVIDPWLVTGLPSSVVGSEVSGDNYGNCTVIGGIGGMQEVFYYDNTGALIWTWNPIGEEDVLAEADISMAPATGDTYVISAFSMGDIVRLDATGTLIGSNPMGDVGLPEPWRIKYSDFHNKITVGEGGLFGADSHIGLLDLDLITYDPYISLPDPVSTMEDCVLFDVDKEEGSFYYLPSAYLDGTNGLYSNRLYKLDATDPSIMLWETVTSHHFIETDNATYDDAANGVNGIACGPNFVYTYDGSKILKFDKITGAIEDSLELETTLFGQYGIDTDNCGNLYVGTVDNILMMDEDFELIESLPIPGSCCDILVTGNYLYASGISFAAQFELEEGGFSLTSTPAYCGDCSGTASLSTDFCEGFEFVGVEWSPGGATTLTASDLCPGWYVATITMTDVDGVEIVEVDSVEVSNTGGLGLAIQSVNDPTCFGFTDGSITVETLGGEMGDVEYEWIPENVIGGATFNNLGAGVYIVIATSEECTDTLEIVLNEPDSIYFDLSIFDILCFGDSTGSAKVDNVYNAQGDLGNISYYWAPNYFGSEGAGVDSAWNMPAGEYVLTVNDDLGCSNILTFTISEPDELIFSEFGFDPAFCRLFGYQSGGGVVYAAASGGTPDYTYEWLNLETMVTTDNSTWGGLNPGMYQITVTDNNGCTLVENVQLDSVNPIAAFTVESDQLNDDCEGTELVIANFINQSENFANPNNPLSDTTFLWNLNHPTADWIISHDYFEVMDSSYIGEAIYEVCLIAMNQNGCADTTCKNLIVHVQPEFIAPNIFTPDGDDKNDMFTFEFLAAGIETFHCQIVNRWGVTVAELNSISEGWNGRDFNGDLCTAGVYFYRYTAVSTNDTVFDGQGTVQLVRN